jgi:hypothetical protein
VAVNNEYVLLHQRTLSGRYSKSLSMEEQAMYKKTKTDDIWRQTSILLNKSISAGI